MSAGRRLQAAVVAHLAGLGRVFDAPPARAAMPYVVVEDPVLAAGDAAGVSGRTGSIAITCIDSGVPRGLPGDIEAAMERLPADVGEGWRVTAVRLAKSQVSPRKGELWAATRVFAVRLYRIN